MVDKEEALKTFAKALEHLKNNPVKFVKIMMCIQAAQTMTDKQVMNGFTKIIDRLNIVLNNIKSITSNEQLKTVLIDISFDLDDIVAALERAYEYTKSMMEDKK